MIAGIHFLCKAQRARQVKLIFKKHISTENVYAEDRELLANFRRRIFQPVLYVMNDLTAMLRNSHLQ